MIKPDRRARKTYLAVRFAVCEIIRSGRQSQFTIKGIAGKAGVSTSAVRRLGRSPQKLLGLFDEEINNEFTRRRTIQGQMRLEQSAADFFMPLQPRYITTEIISGLC